jgi:hypothetical protein
MSASEPGAGAPAPARKAPAWQRLLPWAITVACFAYLYARMTGPAAALGLSVPAYLARTFADVSWGQWLALMAPYSVLFFLVDSAVVWRVINWFNTRVAYADILPVRGSSYILSILNEQVGKGAMGVYLYRRHGVPGWELGSSMLFIMMCELLYLSMWATIGWTIAGDALPGVFSSIPYIFAGVVALFVVLHLVMTRAVGEGETSFTQRPVFRAFREARWWYYPAIAAMRSPAILAAVVVYTLVLRLFGVEVGFATMLGYLPVIFFGAATPGPMRSVAITLWVVLFPEQDPGRMGAFGLVQHNFFIFFNAAIGLIFLRRANRELFGESAPA